MESCYSAVVSIERKVGMSKMEDFFDVLGDCSHRAPKEWVKLYEKHEPNCQRSSRTSALISSLLLSQLIRLAVNKASNKVFL